MNPADPDMQGFGCFPRCPGTLGIHDQPAEPSLRSADIGKVSKDLCLEGLFGRERLFRVDPAGCCNGTDEGEGIRESRRERPDKRCPEPPAEVIPDRHQPGVAEDVEAGSAKRGKVIVREVVHEPYPRRKMKEVEEARIAEAGASASICA